MSEITDLRLTDVRCFEGAQAARLSRITLLVGENSTGKSSFLGCHNVFVQLANFIRLTDRNYFDDEPFRMGGFDTIARSGAREFSVEGKLKDHAHTSVQVTYFRGSDGEPEEQRLRIEFDRRRGVGNYLEICRPVTGGDVWRFRGENFHFDLDRSEVSFVPISTWLSNNVRPGHLPYQGEPANFRKRAGKRASSERQAEFAKLVTLLRTLPMPPPSSTPVEALAPAPPLRQRIYESPPLEQNDRGLMRYLARMGRKLGLFAGLEVSRLPDGDFELLVKMPDGKRNIVDVGYGVYGILWLLKLMYKKPKGTVFLLQQPEVHLHPSAQAALSQLMVESGHRFMVETHSDHIIDRLRICAMRKDMDPGDFSMIYFEPDKDGKKSRIHNISIDENGNLVNEPRGYRRFFLDETNALLGFR